MKANSRKEAWKIVNEVFPTDYMKDEQSSNNAGYPIYRSTAEDHYHDYICDLGNRLEVNLGSTGKTINIWIEEPEEVQELMATVEALQKKVQELEEALEKEQEWKIHEYDGNVKQSEYENLAKSIPHAAHYMTDDEAKDWICSEFDFDRDKITIIHEIPEVEINRHRMCRTTGRMIDRRPIYCATDYYYIRFDTTRWSYEAWNGELRLFYH